MNARILTGRFEERRIAVIGAARGQIGGAVVERIASEGAIVSIGDLHEEKARRVAEDVERAGGRIGHVGKVDVSHDEEVRDFLDASVREMGALNGMMNNAALLEATLDDTDAVSIELGAMDRLLRVNMDGHLLSVRHAVPHLRGNGGSIVLTASISGVQGEPTRVAYGMAKAGVISLARHVAARWGKQGIRCNTISPGRIVNDDTPDSDDRVMDEFLGVAASPRLGKPADIAGAAAFLLSDDAAYVNGENLIVDAAMSQLYRPAPADEEDVYHRFPFSRHALGIDDE